MEPRYEEHLLEDDGRIPNNPRLPLLVYPGALEGGDLRRRFMRELEENGWGGAWAGGVSPTTTTTARRTRRSASSAARRE